MTQTVKPLLTGGCQCGAIRFALTAAPLRITICHCRMCQKATGAPFASLAEVARENFAWTHGKPASFRSSSIAERDFCKACGTPLSYRQNEGSSIEIMTGAFDRPDRVVPTVQLGAESRLGWVGSIANLPSKTTQQIYGTEKLAQVFSYQQPDHD
ncbi:MULTISPECIES: GFA family protein [Rhodopseudomonas]|uniref:Aldehyde-activating protein n=1 Tax=Rhodopseudomonas palustris TaxID=1076 RepID=A0A0D7EIG6_RHOPL|nr:MULTISPECIES: GFA family protein [Rhodopseudomonas]KIZ40446.1 aldehyde-activating protein [Rhodopseudomonas palustris]MDF3808976.1 GFA family protein [Rhodopseudomonas sp. BAL398]WOK20027.1 GFA family protein [Rhodopseudomonas sp. BAL398]